MKNEIKILKDTGFDSVKLVATFKQDHLDFKNMYVARYGKLWRFVQVDHSNCAFTVGDQYDTLNGILSEAQAYLINSWGFKESELTEEVKKEHKIAMLGFDITKEEIGALEYASDVFSSPNQSEMAEMNAYYLSKLVKKLKNLEIN